MPMSSATRGGAADAIRSLAISQQLLGTREVIVIHHTDCGMLTFTNEQLQQKLRDDLGAEATLDFLPFADLEQSVRDDPRNENERLAPEHKVVIGDIGEHGRRRRQSKCPEKRDDLGQAEWNF